ncbi:DotU family type IV/VI secretion system protein [Francisella sp. XLW-1]|uniref:DotU family type IV/VI secretion system protein n=1 Tax=Francisella sp. XLW-1 TaxID=2610887 RepID=UPI00123D2997|nr:DotU family type IV/VI secretion system protein [Francisella sp. XLW-1]
MYQDIIDVFVTINSFIDNYDANVEMQDVVAFRDEVIIKTSNIRDTVYQEHGERASFYIAFAIYTYCDEMMNQVNLNMTKSNPNWHLLQEEVYQRNDGGDYFFEIADSILDNPVFPKEVAQVLYLILALGFKGCYLGVQAEIDKYKNKLSVVLPDQDIHGLSFETFEGVNNKFKKKYKSRILKSLFIASVCFPLVAYFGIWFVS